MIPDLDVAIIDYFNQIPVKVLKTDSLRSTPKVNTQIAFLPQICPINHPKNSHKLLKYIRYPEIYQCHDMLQIQNILENYSLSILITWRTNSRQFRAK